MTSPSTDVLIQHALQARQRAYAPYSRYQVGAALLASDGSVTLGCNVENAAYPACICAERVALTAAVAQGRHDFVALAVVTADGGSPCGICRQVMAELAPNLSVTMADIYGRSRTTTIRDLLPDAFGPRHLLSAASAPSAPPAPSGACHDSPSAPVATQAAI